MNNKILITILSLLTCFNLVAQPTDHTFSYQGELVDNQVAANDNYDIAVQAFDTDTGSNSLTALIEYIPVKVKDGIFTLDNVDLGAITFESSEIWLEISVKKSTDAGGYTPLSPRQKIKAVPYATTLIDGNAQEGQVLTFTSSGWIPDYNIHFSGDYAALAGKPIIPDAPTGLEQVTENGNTGYRIIGRQIGSVGNNAIQLGVYTPSFPNGASGATSFTTGFGTNASGSTSTALGFATNASGSTSTAMGNATTASGEESTASGLATTAQAYVSTAIGTYNIGNGTTDTWVNTDPLFEIGNGTFSTPNNAFTVLKNGNVGIGTHQPTAALEVIGETVLSDTLYASSPDSQYAPDIILKGTGTAGNTDEGVISTDPNAAGSDMWLLSNDAVVIQLDQDNNETGEFEIRNGLNETVLQVQENGDIKQPNIASNGMMKYMVHAYCSNNSSTVAIIKSYNGVSNGAITITTGAASGIGSCQITFPESISDRYWQASAVSYGGRVVSCKVAPSNNILLCDRSDLFNLTSIDGPIMVLVY